jgi:hypothetical protein
MNDEHQTGTLEKGDLDDQALITGVLAGDLSLFTLLVTHHSGRVYALALRLLGNKEEAEDMVQETFIRAYARLNTFRIAGMKGGTEPRPPGKGSVPAMNAPLKTEVCNESVTFLSPFAIILCARCENRDVWWIMYPLPSLCLAAQSRNGALQALFRFIHDCAELPLSTIPSMA